MIKKLFVFIALFLALAAAAHHNNCPCEDRKPDHCHHEHKKPCGHKDYCAPSGKRFAVFDCECKLNREDARKACCAIGARLANLCEGRDFDFIAQKVTWIAWINSFNGSTYRDAALALFPCGGIAVPHGGACTLHGAVCEY